MKPALIVVCDAKTHIFGEVVYRSSAYIIEAVAKALGTDPLELREALLVLGGELEGPHPLSSELIEKSLKGLECCWRHYDEDAEASIEKAVKEALRRRQEVFCSFSFC